MSTRTINVNVGNNLNAIVKGGTNVNARANFNFPNFKPYETPEIPGGRGFGPFQLKFDTSAPDLTIGVGANHLPPATDLKIDVPTNAVALSVDLQGTHNGRIDIQYKFTIEQ